MENVQTADWNPVTGEIGLVHNARIVEHPPGKKIYESKSWISTLRFSPDGKQIALVEHTNYGDNAGFVSLI